jgi:hypothetical protein
MPFEDDMNVTPIICDLETWPLENAADFLEPVQPAKNLVDPVKIKADIQARTVARDEKLALDYNVGAIAALGWWTEEHGIVIRLCENETAECLAIIDFWKAARNRTVVGFNLKGFDLRYLIQRSRYLGIAYPWLDMGKYSRKGVVDLFLELTFYDGIHDQGAMRRTLHAFCRRFGIPVDDTLTGKDCPALAAAGEWHQVEAHLLSDITLTLALARKMGVVSQPKEVSV